MRVALAFFARATLVFLSCKPASTSWAKRRVIEGEEQIEQLGAGGGCDGEADALRGFVEIVAQIEIVPAVSVAHGAVEAAMQIAQRGDVVEGRRGVAHAAGTCSGLGIVKQVVNLGQSQLARRANRRPLREIRFAQLRKYLPRVFIPIRKRKRLKTICRSINRSRFQRLESCVKIHSACSVKIERLNH